MPQKVLITGATGLLGRQVATAFKRSGWTTICTGFTRSTAEIRKLDINDDSAIQHILDKERYVVNPIGSKVLLICPQIQSCSSLCV